MPTRTAIRNVIEQPHPAALGDHRDQWHDSDLRRAIPAEKHGIVEDPQFADILCDLAEDLDDGRLYLPLEDLDRFGVSAEDLKCRRWTPAMAMLIAFETDRVSRGFAELFPTLWFLLQMREVRAAGPAVLTRSTRFRFPDFVNAWRPALCLPITSSMQVEDARHPGHRGAQGHGCHPPWCRPARHDDRLCCSDWPTSA
ncbi:squalene/phytoene synthase family protein [Saccharothrix sp. NPDC042600]|uniref:squalene/phytoene synthase family protein n=1 Tax=Saccharothrix TaxID=2071 RepID=UPI003411E09E|nr:hypothetical protein GCM10017745_75200 [Saccharothrix mutabilis subsp. capreolus]